MAKVIFLVTFLCIFSAVRSLKYKCAGKAQYSLSFWFTWSNQTHPNAFPPGGKFSPPVGCSHNKDYYLWAPGMMASDGVKYVAEMGRIFSSLTLQSIFEVSVIYKQQRENCCTKAMHGRSKF